MFTLHPGWRDRPRRMAVFYAGLVAGSAALVIMAPWFGIYTFTLSFFVFRIPDVAVAAARHDRGGLAGRAPRRPTA